MPTYRQPCCISSSTFQHARSHAHIHIVVNRMQVAFLRTWFAENNVDQFSIAVWFQRRVDLSPKAAIINNRNCRQSPGFSLSCANSEITASVTANSELVLDPAPVSKYRETSHYGILSDPFAMHYRLFSVSYSRENPNFLTIVYGK